MTDHRIEDLANEVAEESGQGLRGFSIEYIDQVDGGMKVTFSWHEPFHIEVSIILSDFDTEESIKEKIRRQLRESA